MTFHKNKIFSLVSFFLIFVSLATESSALNVQKFNPLIGQQNQGVTVYGSDGLRKKNVQAGLFFNTSRKPLEFSLTKDDRVDGIVDDFYTLDALLSYGLTDWFTFHLNVPFNPYSNVEPISNYQGSSDVSMGDLRFSGTINLYRAFDEFNTEVQRGGLALVPFVSVPMDNTDDFFGDTSWTYGGMLALDRHMGKRHYAAINLGAKFRKREQILNLIVDDEMLGAASYVYRLSCKNKWDLITEVQASTTFRKFARQEVSSPVEMFLGLRKQSQSNHWEWTIGGGRGINNGYGAPDFHLFTGISYLFFDRNKPRPHCCDPLPVKEKPIVVTQIVEPTKPVVQNLGNLHVEVVDPRGNPVMVSIKLFKNDQLISHTETNRIRQPIEAGSYRVEVARAGGITENIEVLPNQESYKKIVIPDPAKKPEPVVVYIDPIYFDSNKDTIKAESFAALDQVYSIIQNYPDIQSLQIEAHTDSQGKDAYNLDLSNRRAASAKKYLVTKGVSESKIKSSGFGEARPIGTNETAAGRMKNRRVEFIIESPNQNIKIIQRQ